MNEDIFCIDVNTESFRIDHANVEMVCPDDVEKEKKKPKRSGLLM